MICPVCGGVSCALPVADEAQRASGSGQNFKRPPQGSAEILGTATGNCHHVQKCLVPEGTKSPLYHLEDEKLQIIGLLHTPEDGMIGALLARFDLPQLHACVMGGAAEHFDEQLLAGKMAA